MTRWEAAAGFARRWRLSDRQRRFLGHLFILLAVGVVLLSLGPRPDGDVGDRATDEIGELSREAAYGAGPAADYARALERQVQDALMQLAGGGVVHVAVTVESGARLVLAEDVTTERRTESGTSDGGAGGLGGQAVTEERRSSQPILVRSEQQRREEPVVLVEHAPVVSGVLVIADAAGDEKMRYEMTRAVMTLLGLPAHRVYVLPRQRRRGGPRRLRRQEGKESGV